MIKKILISLLTIFVSLTFTFALIRNMPGDIMYSLAADRASSEGIPFNIAYEEVKGMYGVSTNQPLYKQYLIYVSDLLRGNLGTSVQYLIPVSQIITTALPWTALVLSISITLSFGIGALLGMLAAWKRKTLLDPLVSGYASLTGAIPNYLVAVLLLFVFAINLKWLPLQGAYDVNTTPGFNIPFLLSVLYHAILPVTSYVLEGIGGWALLMKANAVSVLGEDYITAAQARGLKNRRIVVSYVGRNALLPPFTRLAVVFGGMLGGSALIETVFAYPGIGFFFGKAVALRDYPLMQGLLLLTIAGVILANLVADFLYSKLDPRVKAGK